MNLGFCEVIIYKKKISNSKKKEQKKSTMDIQEPQIISYYGLKKEQKKSTMDIQSILNDMVGVGEDKDTILKMFKKLEEENKKLKEEMEELEEYSKIVGAEEKEKEYEELAFEIGGKFQANHPDLMKSMVVLMKSENKKLKEDMKWKDGRIEFLETVKVLDHKDPTHLENKKLKAENSAYLDIINELGDYMARVDQNAVDVFNEITEDSEHVPSRTLE